MQLFRPATNPIFGPRILLGWVVPASCLLIAARGRDVELLLGIAALSAVILLIVPWIQGRLQSSSSIDYRLRELLGDLKRYTVFTRTMPFYRCVDLHRAVEALAREDGGWVQIESQHWESLAIIVHGQFSPGANRAIKKPEYLARPLDRDRETFVPVDGFWVAPIRNEIGGLIRLRLDQYQHEVNIEILAMSMAEAEAQFERILRLASELSVFRHRVLEVSFEQGIRDSYGDVERKDWVDLIFKAEPAVTEDQIILDERIKRIIERNVIDFHERRDELEAAGVPPRRGVLFYGPPGNGKTYTCQYIAHRLKTATTIVVAGRSLHHLASICNIARMLQPAVIVLEDVDLVFTSREENMFGAALGELMDELDGFRESDRVIFILTTNAIDRVERAIRDRPGRVSQCLYFGPPTPALRRRYLSNLLERYDCADLDLDRVVGSTDGVSQAFIKEFVYRAVQIATEHESANGRGLHLRNDHFDEALQEMRASDPASDRIIGFRT